MTCRAYSHAPSDSVAARCVLQHGPRAGYAGAGGRWRSQRRGSVGLFISRCRRACAALAGRCASCAARRGAPHGAPAVSGIRRGVCDRLGALATARLLHRLSRSPGATHAAAGTICRAAFAPRRVHGGHRALSGTPHPRRTTGWPRAFRRGPFARGCTTPGARGTPNRL